MVFAPPRSGLETASSGHYDPWYDLRLNWPRVGLIIRPMTGDLLGELRQHPDSIAIRADSSAAQRRCTLAHEIVHLERGVRECGRWASREERTVHQIASRRLIRTWELVAALREHGGAADRGALAQTLDVDGETLAVRLDSLTPSEIRAVRRALDGARQLWAVA
ncbi:MAG TPA: ImmA/IrrE family metallo-endopeptidase [Jatrophihabitans sp.]|nr:ImmA/IrrE family metallo-endopeptidase [Jatrophihabitans sp.]